MPAADPLAQLDELARMAEEHARAEHGMSIGLDAADQADRVLRMEAARADAARIESLAACYGAWLGRLAVRRWEARWIGLSEAAAPRVRVAGRVISPMDAVRRRLADPASPSLPALLEQADQWSREQGTARAGAIAQNREAWDRLADDARFAGAMDPPQDRASALDEWVRDESIRGKDLLCLGAGGGRQGPLHALAGANVTVVDFSERQLDHDRRAAQAWGVTLRLVLASIDDLKPLTPSSFDVVLQPVSACYVPDVERVYSEVSRVIRPRGLYVVQHKQPANLERETAAREFAHSLDALLGGLCRAGFVIEDFQEPPRGDAWAPADSPAYRACASPPYLKIKARRR